MLGGAPWNKMQKEVNLPPRFLLCLEYNPTYCHIKGVGVVRGLEEGLSSKKLF